VDQVLSTAGADFAVNPAGYDPNYHFQVAWRRAASLRCASGFIEAAARATR